jgi:hypothetical protein
MVTCQKHLTHTIRGPSPINNETSRRAMHACISSDVKKTRKHAINYSVLTTQGRWSIPPHPSLDHGGAKPTTHRTHPLEQGTLNPLAPGEVEFKLLDREHSLGPEQQIGRGGLCAWDTRWRGLSPAMPMSKGFRSRKRIGDLANSTAIRRKRRNTGFTQVQPPRKVKGLRPACLTLYW